MTTTNAVYLIELSAVGNYRSGNYRRWDKSLQLFSKQSSGAAQTGNNNN